MSLQSLAKTMLFLIVAFAMFGLSECGDRFPNYHYKMTVYIGDAAFSSVRSVEVNEGLSIVDSGGTTVRRRVEGEAVAIDFSNDQTVYALLSPPDNPDYPQFVAGMALAPHVPREAPLTDVGRAVAEWRKDNTPQDSFRDAAEGLQAMVKIQGPRNLPKTLPARRGREPMKAWPMFVTFSNPKDQATVREVSPGSIGVTRITIEITDEEVTNRLEQRFPASFWEAWEARRKQNIRDRGGFMNPGDNSYFNSLTGRLSKGNFISRSE